MITSTTLTVLRHSDRRVGGDAVGNGGHLVDHLAHRARSRRGDDDALALGTMEA